LEEIDLNRLQTNAGSNPVLTTMEKEFTAADMIEFANWYGEDITEMELRSFRDALKQRAEQEYQLYLELKAKYEQ
jgi:hypothetical protein